MAITIIQERKKQRYLTLIFALIIFAILAVVWLGFSRRQGVSPPQVSGTVYILPEANIDWQMLEDIRRSSLQPLEEISAFEGQFGRENPFSPY